MYTCGNRRHGGAARARSSRGRTSDLFRTGRVTAVGLATAVVVDLVAIAPAAGVVSPLAVLAVGLGATFPSYFFTRLSLWRI